MLKFYFNVFPSPGLHFPSLAIRHIHFWIITRESYALNYPAFRALQQIYMMFLSTVFRQHFIRLLHPSNIALCGAKKLVNIRYEKNNFY